MNLSDIKALEHPTLKVPYEILNKKFRSAQKVIDREISHVQSSASDLEKNCETSGNVGDIQQLLGSMVEKLNLLKRKAGESINEEVDAASVCKRRIEHLKCCEDESWRKRRLDRMLVEHFLRSGYYSTALKLAERMQVTDLTNIELFLISKEVEDALLKKDTSKCLAWCYDNKSKLRKLKSSLEFNIRRQEFVELIKDGQRIEAVKHARKHFTNLEDDHLKEVQRAMGLLAFPVTTDIVPYKELLSPNRWQMLVEQFREENYKLYQLSNISVFSVALQAGLSALKTPQCYQADANPDCPVCSKHLNELAKPLPYAHCSQSRLVCYISGKPLNEHNQPLMLPNGYVYGETALEAMAAANKGRVTCPRTKETYDLSQALRVFVM